MSRHRDDHLDLCAARVLGVLDDAGRSELDTHMAEGCALCESELRELAAGAMVLAMSAPQHRAPAQYSWMVPGWLTSSRGTMVRPI